LCDFGPPNLKRVILTPQAYPLSDFVAPTHFGAVVANFNNVACHVFTNVDIIFFSKQGLEWSIHLGK